MFLVLVLASVLFRILITSLWEERAGLYVSRALYALLLFFPLGVMGLLRLVIVTLTGLLFEPRHEKTCLRGLRPV